MRTIDEIRQQTTAILKDELASAGIELNTSTWSATNILRLLVFVFSVAAYYLEKIFATLTADTNTYIANMKPHTLLWYANKAKLYQHGRDLVPNEDYYDNDGVSDEVLKNEKIVKHSAVVEAANQYGRLFLRIKLAGEQDDELIPLSVAQVNGLKEYFKTIKDAGVMINVESYNPDKIRMSWKIFYDPLIIDAEGNRLDGTTNDVGRVAIKDYLKKLPFNGTYALQKHEDHVQTYPGIVLCPIQYAQTKWGGFDWENVNVKIVPDAGYLRFEDDADLTIEYIAQSEI